MSQSRIAERPSLSTIQGISALTGLRSSFTLSESDLPNEAENEFKATTNHQEMLKWIVMLIGAFTILKTIASAFWQIALGTFPALFLYLRHTCPDKESFDKRKELKRVLRGHHLADDHPDKPKSYFDRMMAKASASVTAETAVFAGTDIHVTSYQGAFLLVDMKVPSINVRLYWIGIAGSWRYLFSKQLGDAKKTN
jgi:hypothetical protein